ncbi:hypothetical protein CYMTET_49531 [Cymbomonas tetramitiformis]|uniref:SAP domain-containing protein n=1 Tax=Cymbomonas tetramitiformis TaxID=36881 RepID=A0AAE0BQ00_9CHLO|nr:hypothetical protein CYMTET_49531 [Cymbomonas tetramitiformis]
MCATQFRCPRCTPESGLPEDKRPPVKLVEDISELSKLSASQLLEECKLHTIGKSGNKGVLIDRLTKAIQKATFAKSSVPPVTPRTRQGPSTATAAKTAVSSGKKSKKTEIVDDSPWVHITQEQAASAR